MHLEEMRGKDSIDRMAAPQTIVREHVREVAPWLNDFDVLAMGYVVTSKCVTWKAYQL